MEAWSTASDPEGPEIRSGPLALRTKSDGAARGYPVAAGSTTSLTRVRCGRSPVFVIWQVTAPPRVISNCSPATGTAVTAPVVRSRRSQVHGPGT